MRGILAVLLCALVVACAPQGATQEQVAAEPQPSLEKQMPPKETLVDKLRKGASLKCTTQVGEQTSTLYMKAGKVRIDTMPADAHGIYTTAMAHTWTKKQGARVDIDQVTAVARVMGQDYEPQTPEEIVASSAHAVSNCKEVRVPEKVFKPPEDVTFQDVASMLASMRTLVDNN